MVKIRLQRHGRKKLPYYHIVVADSRSRRDGRIIEDLGRYSPTERPAMVKVNADRVIHWLNNGAQPTDTVRSILKKEGIYYRMHLVRWGKSAEEIQQAIEEFKANRAEKSNSISDQRKAALKKEAERVSKDEAARAAEAEKKAREAEKKAAEAPAEEARAEEAAPAEAAEAPVEEAKAEESAPAEAAEAPAEEAKAEEAAPAEAAEAPAEEVKAEEAAPAEAAEAPAEEAKAEEADGSGTEEEKK